MLFFFLTVLICLKNGEFVILNVLGVISMKIGM